MSDVALRPIQEADLDDLCRYVTDPEAGGEFEWAGFRDPKALRRRCTPSSATVRDRAAEPGLEMQDQLERGWAGQDRRPGILVAEPLVEGSRSLRSSGRQAAKTLQSREANRVMCTRAPSGSCGGRVHGPAAEQ
jgi:hypothetical protein